MQIYSKKKSLNFVLSASRMSQLRTQLCLYATNSPILVYFFVLSDLNRFLNLSSLLQFRLRVPRPHLSSTLHEFFQGGTFSLAVLFCFSPTPPPLSSSHFLNGQSLNHLLIYCQLNKDPSLIRCQMLAVWSGQLFVLTQYNISVQALLN